MMSTLKAVGLIILLLVGVYAGAYTAAFHMSRNQIESEMQTIHNDTQRQIGLTAAQSDIDANTTEYQPPAEVVWSD